MLIDIIIVVVFSILCGALLPFVIVPLLNRFYGR